VQNLSGGAAAVRIAHAPAWSTIAPAAATIHAKQQQSFVFRVPSASPGPLPTDSVVFAGVPSDLWNSSPHTAQIAARFDEPDNPLSTDVELVSVGSSPARTLVAAGWPARNLYTVDPGSGHTQLLTNGLEQQTSNVPLFAPGGDGLLYIAQPLFEFPRRTLLWSVGQTGTLDNYTPLNVALGAFAVTADRVLYASSADKADTIFWRSLRDSTVSGKITGGARPAQFQTPTVSGMVLSPFDHQLYYTTPEGFASADAAPALLHRLDPSTKSSAAVGTVAGRIAAVDERGYIYTLYGTARINVYDSSGRLLDTRWPSIDPYTIAVDRDWIYGIDLTKKTTIFRLPVKAY
jgi:hypothetical protein